MGKNKPILLAITVLLILIIGLVFASSRIGKTDTPASVAQYTRQTTKIEPALRVGDSFPELEVTEVNGRTLTNNSLVGKPAIVWFTTSWCAPCQIGAQKVSKLDDELGGNAFNVLVIFVDPQEKPTDLISWRKSFAREDWMVAFDNELTKLAARVDLKFLDSKFLLDKNGIIKNIDFKIADESYLNTIRAVVKEDRR